MAATQTQYNFIKFAANNDEATFKGKLAGILIVKPLRTTIGTVRITNAASQFDIVPQFQISSLVPAVYIPLIGCSPVVGLKAVICSNVNIIAIRE